MSIFFEGNCPNFSSDNFEIVFYNYICFQSAKNLDLKKVGFGKLKLGEFYDRDDEEKRIQHTIDNSNFQLRAYGTAQEFAEQLRIYRTFPESDKFFFTSAATPYYATPILYRSLKNEQYIFKGDHFVLLQNMILHIVPQWNSQILRAMMSVFLKWKEGIDQLELVRYDPNIFEEIQTEIRDSIQCYIDSGQVLDSSNIGWSSSSFDSTLEQFLKLIPVAWDGSDFLTRIRSLLEYLFNHHSGTIVWVYNSTRKTIECLQNAINKRPEMFLHMSKTTHNKQKRTITVRLFDDGLQKFVMKTELFQAINKASPERDPIIYEDESERVDAITMKEISREFGDRVQNIEFILTPIVRAKHKAVPIRCAYSNDFCSFAVEALFDILKMVIFGGKFFQKGPSLARIQLYSISNQLESFFPPDIKHPFFVKKKHLSSIARLCHEEIELCDRATGKHLFSTAAKDIRNAKADGFTVDNLKNELKHLDLEKMFPEITDYAEVAYAEVMKVKKEKYLRTCDLFDAIEHCQLICYFNHHPTLKTFLHNQKACGRVLGLKCELCIGTLSSTMASDNTDSENTKEAADSDPVTTTTVEKCDENDNKNNEILPKKIELDNNAQCVSNAEVVILKKDIELCQEPLRNVITQSYEAVDLQEDKPKEACNKCSKTDGVLDETKKTLKASETKMKKLEKKVSAIENELAEMKNKSEKSIDRLKKDLEKAQAENQKLIGESVAHVKIVKENEELKLKITKCGNVEAQLKETNSKRKTTFDKERLQFSAKISELENELESKNQAIVKFEEEVNELKQRCGSENQRTSNLEQEIVELRQQLGRSDDKKEEKDKWISERRHLQEDILEKTRKINEIHESNIKLRTENEVNSKMVQNLLDKLAAVSIASVNGPMNRSSNMYHLQSHGSAPFFYNHPMYSYGSEVPIQTPPSPHSIDDNRLPSTSSVNENSPTSSSMTSQKMQPAVNPNILNTGNVPGARVFPKNSVPSTPPVNNNTSSSSSKHPEKRNWNDQKTTANSELTDSECLICVAEMRSRQKTIKCHQCRRRFHSNCASKWLKVKSECPACRGRFLDPKEYPSLA